MWCYSRAMRSRERSVTTLASKSDEIWRRWTDTTCWPQDDSEVQHAEFESTPALGVTGTLVPTKGPRSTMKISSIETNRCFDIATKLPGALMLFQHEMNFLSNEELVITHRVVFTGPLSLLFDRLIGSSIEKGFPTVMTNIVERSR